MRRRRAIPLALVWIVAMLGFDLWLLARSRVADAHLNRILGEMFEAPVSFGRLSIGAALDVVIEDVSVKRPDHLDKIYGTIDEIRIAPVWWDLITALSVNVKEIEVTNPTVVVKWRPDRTFDMPSPLRSDLEAQTRTMGELPAIVVRGLTLVLDNPPHFVKRNRQDFVFENLAITLAPEGSSRWLYFFEIDIDHKMLGRIVGSGKFSKTAFQVHLKHHGVSVTGDLLDVLTPELAAVLGDLQVSGGLALSAAVEPVRGGAAEALSAVIDCQDVDVRSQHYGLSIKDIGGKITFEDGVWRSDGLTALFEDAQIEAHGKIDLTRASRAVDVRGQVIGLPVTNALAAKIRKLPDPCPTVAEQIEAWDPDGNANVEFRLERDRDEHGVLEPLHPFIDVEFKGATRLRYIGHVGDDGRRRGFPYPIEDLRGILKFTDKAVTFERLTALNGSLAVDARGRIDYEFGGDETYDVDVDARGLRLDGRVSEALTPGSRELFNSLDADGAVDLSVAVKRKRGEPVGPHVTVVVDLQGVAMSPRPFPLSLADARGRVIIPDTGAVIIERVTARRGGGSFALQGSVPVERGESDMSLEVMLDKFPIDPAVTNALGTLIPDSAGALAKLNPTGLVDGSLRISVDKAGALRDLDGKFSFEDMTLVTEDPSLRIEDLDGSVTVTSSAVTINPGTTASIAGEHFAIRGVVHDGGGLDLVVEAENFHVDRELLAEVEPLVPWIRRFRRPPKIDGPMSISLKVTGDAEEPEISAVIDLLGVDVDPQTMPGLRLLDLRAHATMTPLGVVEFRDVAARMTMPDPPAASRPAPVPEPVATSRPTVAIAVSNGTFTPASPPARASLVVGPFSVEGAVLDASTLALVPVGPELAQKLITFAPEASINLAAGKLVWDGITATVSRAQMRASKFAFGAERPIVIDDVQLDRLSVTAGGGLFDLRGDFIFRGAKIFDVPVPIIIGKVAADAGGIRFESIEADLYQYEVRDGRRYALGKVNPELSRVEVNFDGGTFDARFRIQEVNLPATIRVMGGTPGGVSGTFRSALDLSGTIGQPETYTGRGDLSLRARDVISLPVFYKMFNSLDVLAIFDRTDPWTRVEVAFDLRDQVVDMRRIRIDAPDVVLAGAGSLTFAGMVRADLKVSTNLGLSPFGWVTKIISRVVFSGVRIEGPVGDPRISPYTIGG